MVLFNSPVPEPATTLLTYDQVYDCPVCRRGDLSELTLMDAFACSYCRHIFGASITEQTIRLADGIQPFQWRWDGRQWRPLQQADLELTLVVWLTGIALITLPPLLIWLPYHTFPPLPGSRWSQFPVLWLVGSFLSHLLVVLWLFLEHYQLPWYVATKIQLQRWRGQL